MADEPLDQLDQDYQSWAANKTPQAAGKLLTSLEPTLSQGIRTFVGQSNPNLHSQAKQLALRALNTYDPAQGKLPSHVMNHLRGLQRYAHKQSAILPIPERQRWMSGRMQQANGDLEDELGRPATVQELAEHLGWPVKQIRQLQQLPWGITAGQLESGGAGPYLPAVGQAGSTAWVDLVYPDLSSTQQLIIDHTLGLHGRDQLSNQALARKLRVTPGFVSQQKARIQAMLDKEQLLSPL